MAAGKKDAQHSQTKQCDPVVRREIPPPSVFLQLDFSLKHVEFITHLYLYPHHGNKPLKFLTKQQSHSLYETTWHVKGMLKYFLVVKCPVKILFSSW